MVAGGARALDLMIALEGNMVSAWVLVICNGIVKAIKTLPSRITVISETKFSRRGSCDVLESDEWGSILKMMTSNSFSSAEVETLGRTYGVIDSTC